MERNDDDVFAIDKDRLDEEWVNQPLLYYKYAMKLADAREDFERAKARKDVVEAELDAAIRRDPPAFGLEKITEDALKKAIIRQRRYTEAQEELIKARHSMDVLEVKVNTLDHKKRGLEKLVDLRLKEYFSEPRASAGAREDMGRVSRDAAFRPRKKRD